MGFSLALPFFSKKGKANQIFEIFEESGFFKMTLTSFLLALVKGSIVVKLNDFGFKWFRSYGYF